MYEKVEKTPEKKSQIEANGVSQRQNSNTPTSRFVDNRPEAIQMRKLRDLVKDSPQNARLRELHTLATAHSVTQKKSNAKKSIGLVDNRAEAIQQKTLIQVMGKGRIQQKNEGKDTYDKNTITKRSPNRSTPFFSSSVVQGYFESSYKEGVYGTYRHADDFSVVTDSKHGLYAETGKAATATAVLQGLGSSIELKETAASENFWEGNRLWKTRKKTLKKIEAKNTKNNNEGDDMTLFADCGKACAEVIGGSNRHAVHKPTDHTTISTGEGIASHRGGMNYASGNPNGMKIEIMQKKLAEEYHHYKTDLGRKDAIHKIFNDAIPFHLTLENYVNKYKDPKDTTVTTLDGYWPLLNQLAEHYLKEDNAKEELTRDAIGNYLGINKKANPSVGEGYTIATGGQNVPGARTWTFHWAGVVMESNDNKDKVVLENYAVGDPNVENNEWKFEMHGTEKDGQSFHEQHLATDQHGDRPTTMVVKKN